MLCRQIIGFCNLILQAQEAAVGTEDYEKWMTVTRKVAPKPLTSSRLLVGIRDEV